jgi:acyl-CoA reductase-like NAD-dependent aldehyde dehydrogenase
LTYLLENKSVQEELKLSEEQNKQIKEFAEKQRENRPDFQGLEREEIQKKLAERAKAERDALAKILKPDQLKRVRQISLQQQVRRSLGFALNNQELAKGLKISDEQKEKIQEINRGAFEEMQGLGRD